MQRLETLGPACIEHHVTPVVLQSCSTGCRWDLRSERIFTPSVLTSVMVGPGVGADLANRLGALLGVSESAGFADGERADLCDRPPIGRFT
jgi:hypothetical protein